jgi:predicted acyl esterase
MLRSTSNHIRSFRNVTSQYEPLVEPGRLMLNIPVPMRDGVNLSADIWLPDSSQGEGSNE